MGSAFWVSGGKTESTLEFWVPPHPPTATQRLAEPVILSVHHRVELQSHVVLMLFSACSNSLNI